MDNRVQIKKASYEPLILAGLALALVAAFFFSPIITGDDWGIFHGAGRQALRGYISYSQVVTFSYFYNPPWVAVLLAPLSLLPLRLGWAVICVANLIAIVAIGSRWKLGRLKTILAVASPSSIYILLHGQLDALLLTGLFLPAAWWGVVALSKPQVTIGFLAGIPRPVWLRAFLVTAGVILVTLLIYGNWVADWLATPRPSVQAPHNLWMGLWPFQLPVGVALILFGMSRSDEKLLVAGSPFLLPYAATSSLIGPWLAGSTFLKDWQAALVWLSWWGAVIYRMAGGAA